MDDHSEVLSKLKNEILAFNDSTIISGNLCLYNLRKDQENRLIELLRSVAHNHHTDEELISIFKRNILLLRANNDLVILGFDSLIKSLSDDIENGR